MKLKMLLFILKLIFHLQSDPFPIQLEFLQTLNTSDII